MNWNNELELTFIDCFRAEPILWDTRMEEYKNRFKTHDAWMRISSVMEIPVDELRKKKDSLMSSYRSYKMKVKKSIQSGVSADEIYQPIWFAYDAMDDFLGDTLKCKKSVNTECGFKETVETKETNPEATEENLEESNDSQSQSTTIKKDSNPTIRRRKNPPELVDAGNVVKDALATFKATLKKNESTIPPTQQDDDCDLYGKLLAKKLRKLSENNRLKFMHEVDGMYLSYQFDEPPLVSTPSPTQLPLQPFNLNDFNRNNQSHFLYDEPRPGTSTSTHSEPPMHHGQVITKSRYNRNIVSGPASNFIIQSNRLICTPDTEFPVLHIPNQDNTDQENIIQTAFKFS